MIKLKNNFLQNLNMGENIPCWLEGLIPEAKGYGVFFLWKKVKSPCIYLVPEEKEAEAIYLDLKNFLPEKTFLLPVQDKTTSGGLHQLLYRLNQEKNFILISSIKAAFQPVPPFDVISSSNILIKKNREINRDELVRWLVKKGYYSSFLVANKGEFAVRGSIVDIYSPHSIYPFRIEFFADKVESIREFDPTTQRSIKKIEESLILPLNELNSMPRDNLHPFLLHIPAWYHLILDEPLNIAKELTSPEYKKIIGEKATFFISTLPQDVEWIKLKQKISCRTSYLPFYRGNLDLLCRDTRNWQEEGYSVTIITSTLQQAKRFQELLEERNLYFDLKERFEHPASERSLSIMPGDFRRGFIFEQTKDVIISDADIFKKYKQRKRIRDTSFEEKIKSWSELKQGDYVVHIDYGIGIFRGLVSLKVEDRWSDYFQVDYKGSDRLYIPFNQLDRLHKYVGDLDNPPPLYSLEGGGWELTKRRVREATRELASSLLKLYSIRKAKPGHSFSHDTLWQLQFEASFPYEETPDQLTATQQIKQDMEVPFPMDRLICGDSGYGKTEVAIRASFKAVMDNKQVAVLVPTTILAEQHLRTFSGRMQEYPIRVEMLSRFQSPKKQKEVIHDLKDGRVDIIIGTHRLLQNDIRFKELGLVIIDEEHRFGVRQKKKLKELRKTVDVLTLSATPIPRSLYMALSGIYRLSTIFSSPQERQIVETELLPYNDKTVKDAILRELFRGGQVFYLYNRVKDIQKVADRLKAMLPEAKIAVAHGQMSSVRLEKTIIDFINVKYDILVCTSIIESGIDMPNVNTLIVENSEQFGLADLYQIRGRVGRSKRKGYAYFLFDPTKILTDQAKRRLQTIHQFKGSGAGFRIAMEDLQIRGAGNLLGKEQHGHIASIGFTLYSQLLIEEIKKLKGEKVKPSFPFHMDLGIEARIPPYFVCSEIERMQLYQKIGQIEKEKNLLDLKEELKDRFGQLPSPTHNLIHLLHIKLVAGEVGIYSISRNFNNTIKISFSPLQVLDEKKKEKIKSAFGNLIRILPQDDKNILLSKPAGKKEEELLVWLRSLLQKLKDVLLI
ncbi:transcription-repair coupling factor [Candidatus Aerophobetes bacterium]|nr:transcription-repair coupling factor [Candidatus Aerophobetes bacterium]